jgi:hypothetical protein
MQMDARDGVEIYTNKYNKSYFFMCMFKVTYLKIQYSNNKIWYLSFIKTSLGCFGWFVC